jgi:DNA-binding NarL/FixJ family response regulator
VEKKLLVVDDHPIIFQAVRAVARDIFPDVQVLHAISLSSALRVYRDHLNISLVLLDLSLPDSRHTEGIALLLEEFPKISIVIYSGQNDDTVRRACLRSGAKEFITKCGDTQALAETISRYLDVPSLQLAKSSAMAKADLSFRQAHVLKLLLNGLTAREIATHLTIGESTVKSHIKTIYKRTECHNRVELAKWFSRAVPGSEWASEPSTKLASAVRVIPELTREMI